MSGESLTHVQRTFWRLAARPAAAGVRRGVRMCPATRQRPKRTVARRVRIHGSVVATIADRLREARRLQARLRHVLNLYASPHMAGGRSLAGDRYADGARRQDPRILWDACVDVAGELLEIAKRIELASQPTPTDALPGTREKVEEMARRLERFESLHHERDARRG